jgi:hypothetical protein
VQIDDALWSPRIEQARTVTLPHVWRMNEKTGVIDNFAKAAGRMAPDAQYPILESDVHV